MISRPRRNRKSETVRSFQRETWLGAQHLIAPLFIHQNEGDEGISSMPNCSRLGPSGVLREIEACLEVGIRSFVFSPPRQTI